MGHYFLNFIVYTAAMIGIIVVALYVYKNSVVTSQKSSKTNFLKVEDTISIGPRKQLFVLRAGNERFLIASDAERTTFLSKLEYSGKNKKQTEENIQPQIAEQIPKSHYFEGYENSKSAIRKFAKKLDL